MDLPLTFLKRRSSNDVGTQMAQTSSNPPSNKLNERQDDANGNCEGVESLTSDVGQKRSHEKENDGLGNV